VLQKDTSRRSRLLLPVVAVCAAGMLATACQSTSSSGGTGTGTSGTGSPAASRAQLSITPATGSRGANPADGITVTAAHGKIKTVAVAGDPVTGTLNSAGTVWHST